MMFGWCVSSMAAISRASSFCAFWSILAFSMTLTATFSAAPVPAGPRPPTLGYHVHAQPDLGEVAGAQLLAQPVEADALAQRHLLLHADVVGEAGEQLLVEGRAAGALGRQRLGRAHALQRRRAGRVGRAAGVMLALQRREGWGGGLGYGRRVTTGSNPESPEFRPARLAFSKVGAELQLVACSGRRCATDRAKNWHLKNSSE